MWPGVSFWNRDIDSIAPQAVLDDLARGTATEPGRVRLTTLGSLAGEAFETHSPYGHTRWVLPIGVYHRVRGRFGLQCCTKCLAQKPYYRRSWRLGFITICTRHRQRLIDRCPQCALPIVFHRSELGDRNLFDATLRPVCYSCLFDYTKAHSRLVAPNSRILIHQLRVERALFDGYTMLGEQPIYSHLYLAGIYLLVRFCATGFYSRELRLELTRRTTLSMFDPSWNGPGRCLEHLEIDDRYRLQLLVALLLEDWPTRFEHFFDYVGVSSSRLRLPMDTPYWLSVRLRILDKSCYSPSVSELQSIISYIRSRSDEVSRESVATLSGNREWFRKRHLLHLMR